MVQSLRLQCRGTDNLAGSWRWSRCSSGANSSSTEPFWNPWCLGWYHLLVAQDIQDLHPHPDLHSVREAAVGSSASTCFVQLARSDMLANLAHNPILFDFLEGRAPHRKYVTWYIRYSLFRFIIVQALSFQTNHNFVQRKSVGNPNKCRRTRL